MTSREFNQRTSAAKKAARSGPVIVTNRGTPEHVLLSYDQYVELAGEALTVAEAFAHMPDVSDIDADFPRFPGLPLVNPWDSPSRE